MKRPGPQTEFVMERLNRTLPRGRRNWRLLPFLTLTLWLAVATAWSATAPTITAISNQATNEDFTAGPYAFTIGDAESGAGSLNLRGFSSNTNLVRLSGILFSHSDSNGLVSLQPVADAFGSVTITVFVDDGALTNSESFTVTFNAVNDPPVITYLDTNPFIISEDSSSIALDLVVTDVDTAQGSLVVTGSSSLPGVVTPAGFAFSGSGSNRTVVLTPQPNENTSVAGTTVTLRVSDGEFEATDTFTLRVTPVPDLPAITGTLGGAASPISDRFLTNLFNGITIVDVDHLKQLSETVHVIAVLGTNAAPFGVFSNTDSVITSGTPPNVTTQFRAFQFAPFANSVPVGQTGSFSLTIYASNASSAAVSSTFQVFVFSDNDAPSVASTLSPDAMLDTQNVLPFFVTVSDPDIGDEEQLTLTIEPVNDPTFTYGTLEPAAPSFTGNKAFLESAVRSVRYRATANASATNFTVRLRVRVTDVHGGSSATTNQLTIVAANDAPSIVGVSSTTFRITDDPSQPLLKPFQTVSIVDLDQGGLQPMTVTLSIDDSAKGAYEPTNVYSGTPAFVTDQIRLTGFRPKQRPNRVVGETVNATLTIVAVDSLGAPRTDNGTHVAITSVNGAPVFNGVPTNQPVLISPAAQVSPFLGISVADDDTNLLTLTVTLDNPAKGVLTNLTGGFALISPGVYRIIANQTNASLALTNLKFVVSATHVFPPNEPGGTTFTLHAKDSVLNTATKTLKILLQFAPRNHFVTRIDDDLLPGSLRYAITNTGNNDTITFALPAYPALIRLDKNRGPIKLTRNLTIKGPGADLLTISGDTDGNLVPDTQLFRIHATVVMEGLTLTRGSGTRGETEGTGGAIYVGLNGGLTMRACAVTDSTASQWGGAIDVDRGALALEQCLIKGNANNVSLGLGGGGVSIYTDRACSFVNTTFSANRQRSTSGFGGGAIYAENYTPATELPVSVVHCTFAQNQDAAVLGSSLHANVFGTVITVRNSIFNDLSGLALEVAGSGEIISQGGNICDDLTRTTLMQGGQPQSIVLLDQPSDAPSTSPLLTAFDSLIKPTPAYGLQAGSPAHGRAVNALPTDQRNVWRDNQPDAGAVEFEATRRVVINELHFDPAVGQSRFVEVYVPRNSAPVNLGDYSLFVDGVARHTFSNVVIQPGFGVIVADAAMSANGTRVEIATATLAMTNRGSLEIRKSGLGGLPVVALTYNGVWADPTTPSLNKVFPNTSLTLAPQFLGFALLPNSLVLAPPLGGADLARNTSANRTSPGADTSPTPFGSPNAFPVAVPDALVVSEDNLTTVLALANDLDADGLDQLVIVDVSRGTNAGTIGKFATNTAAGAFVSVTPSNSPLRGAALLYDPRGSSNIQRLAVGAELTDSFYYQILDVGTGLIQSYATLSNVTAIVSPGHRLTNGTVIVITNAAEPGYNGEFAIININDDTFTIPVLFSSDSAPRGSWQTKNTRLPSTPSEAKVTLQIIGVNDAPLPGNDLVATDEDTVLRVMASPNLAGSSTVFATDVQYPHPPQNSPVSLLPNDTDIDTDDHSGTLKVVGVVGSVLAITGYQGTVGLAPLVVQSTNHGLASGQRILLSGYGGHASYNGFHFVTVINSNSFSIPVYYVDNAAVKGVWAVLTDATRLTATSLFGAAVKLEIRADRIETSLVYNPRTSSFLNGLALGESTNDVFYYAVEDSHGGTSFGRVDVQVAGVNDTPNPVSDPGSLGGLTALVGSGQTLSQVVAQLSVVYVLPPASGESNRVDATVLFAGNPPAYALSNLWRTDEQTSLLILSTNLLANDSDVDRSDVLTVSAVSAFSAQGAAVTLGGGGLVLTYDPSVSTNLNKLAREETTLDSFFATITDSRGGNVTTLVAVIVFGVNDTPVARDDSTGTPEDVAISFNPIFFPTNNPALFDSDVDVNGLAPDNRTNVISVANLQTPGGALVNIASNQVSYDPSVSAFLDGLALGQSFVDTFDYTVTDSSMFFANDDAFKVTADGSNFPLDVLANDRNFNLDGGAFAITAIGTPSHGGAVVIRPGGTNLTYTPEINFVGTEVFTYTLTDAQGNIDRALVTVRVTLNQLNGNIFAGADHYSVAKGESPLLNVLANDNTLPLPGTALTITRIVTTPGRDSVSIVGNQIRYSQTNGGPFPYTETFTYEISGGGTARALGQVTVQIVNREGTLSVRNDVFSIASGVQDAALDVLANDTIVSNSSAGLRIRGIVLAPAHGTATTNGAGTIVRYTPASGFVGQDTFKYLATDGFGGTGTGVVTVVVGSLSTSGDFFVVPFDSSAETNDNGVAELDVLANDGVIGAGGDSITIINVTPANPSLGTMSIKAGGKKLLFDPATDQEGEVEFTYTILDGSANVTAEGRVTVVVVREGVNANPDYFAVLSGSSANSLHVLFNDAAIPDLGRTLTIVSIGTGSDAPNHGGNVVLNGTNDRLIYTPAPGFSGEETFIYTMTDSRQSDTARVSVRVTGGALAANDDAFTIFFGTNANGTAISFTLPVLVNDRALPDFGQVLSIVGVGINDVNSTNAPSQQGTVAISADGSALIYTPGDFDGPFPYVERFTYEISDGTAQRAEGVVVVEVQQRANARDLETHDDEFAVRSGSLNNGLPLLGNDNVKPANATGWIITSLTPPTHNGAVNISGQSVFYSPQPGFIGTDEFSYTVSDGSGGTGQATVRVKVGDFSACNDVFVALSGTTNNVLGVLLNDVPTINDKTLLLNAVGVPDRGGLVAINPAGTVLWYAPDPDFETNHPGATYPYLEQFHYDVADDSGQTFRGLVTVHVFKAGSDQDTAQISITVAGVNDAPTITNTVPVPLITDKQTGTPFANVRIHDVDNQGTELLTVTVIIDRIAKGVLTNLGGFVESPTGTYTKTGTPTNVTAATRALVFVPVENRIIVPTIENTVFTILAGDTHVITTNSVTQPVQAVNDPPVISGMVAGLRVYHRATLRPFYKGLITEVDDSTTQALVVRVTLDNPIKGYLTALSGFVSNGLGVYTLSNRTAASASQTLRALIFVPTTANRVVLGTNETTRFTVSVNDGFAPAVLNTNTTVTAVAGLVARTQASDGDSDDDKYGYAVAATRDFVAVGQPEDDHNNETGSAFIYARRLDGSEAWDEVKKLYPPGGGNGDKFGYAVAMSGDLLVVGAPENNTGGSDAGAAYIFARHQGGSNQWGFVQRLTASDAASDDEFGNAVSIDGDTIVVGAHDDNDRGSDSGSAYVFERTGTNWTQVRKLTASDGSSDDEFGYSLAVQGDTLVVGARDHNGAGSDSGAAYVFDRHQGGTNQWGQVKKLTASNPSSDDHFGTSVALDRDLIVVGSPSDNALDTDSGSAYLFRRHQGGSNQWGQIKMLLASDGADSDRFGRSVGVDGDNVVVGASGSNARGSDSGAAYLYARHAGGTNLWSQTEKFIPGNNSANGHFGFALSVRHDTLVVGAPNEEPPGGKEGTIYIYRLKYNNAPMLALPIPELYASPNAPFQFVLPPGTFADADLPESLVLSTGPLPAWLTFDPLTSTFDGLPTFANVGSHFITIFATDADQASVSGVWEIEVGLATPETTPPALGAPADLILPFHAPLPDADFAGGSVTDDTDPAPTVTHVGDTTSGVCPLTVTRLYQATDWFGNSSTCVQTIMLDDTTPPVITGETNPVVAFGDAWDFVEPTVTDECTLASLSVFSTTTNNQCGGTYTVTRVWLAIDQCGNSLASTQIVSVVDTVAPALTSPADLTVECVLDVPAPDFTGGSVFDLSDASPLVTHVSDVSAGVNPRVITRTYVATDVCGNSATNTQTIIVEDTLAPLLTIPADVFVAAETNLCAVTNLALGSALASDNCAVSVTNDAPLSFALGTTRVVWTATDAVGHSVSLTQLVTVGDSTLAITTQPQSQTNQPGGNVMFSITATGCAELNYAWSFGTNLLAGATNATLTLTNLLAGQAGDYSVVVGNAGGSLTSVVAVLTLNQAPVANLDGAATVQNQPVVITSASLLANDTDPDLDPLVISTVSATSTNGAVVTWSGGDITYTPLLNFAGPDRFTYTVADGQGATATSEVEVFVSAVPLPAANQLTLHSVPEGRVVLFLGTPGATYELERSTNLLDWTPIFTNTPLHGVLQYVETNGPAGGAFYRVFKP